LDTDDSFNNVLGRTVRKGENRRTSSMSNFASRSENNVNIRGPEHSQQPYTNHGIMTQKQNQDYSMPQYVNHFSKTTGSRTEKPFLKSESNLHQLKLMGVNLAREIGSDNPFK